MADNEEYQREQQLLREIARLEAENVMLQAELETAVQNIAVVADNVDTMSRDVLDDVLALRTHTASVDESVDVVKRAIEDLSHRYFLFKNLSTASKKPHTVHGRVLHALCVFPQAAAYHTGLRDRAG